MMSDLKKTPSGLWRPHWDTCWDEWIDADQQFEPFVLDLAFKYLKRFGVAIDAGAHIGTDTIRLARHFSRVLAFEPQDENFECLHRNCGELPNVEIYPAALGEKLGRCGLRYHGGNGGEFTVTKGQRNLMITIDSLKLPTVDFIKMDVEGYELFALRGAEETLTRAKPLVLIETNDVSMIHHNIAKDAAGKFLKGLGMTFIEATPEFGNKLYGWPT